FFFDADAGVNLKAFAKGGGRYAITHPLLELIKLPVITCGIVLSKVSAMSLSEASFHVALGITPLASSLSIVLLHPTLVRLGFGASTALLATAFFAFWNSNLLFAVIPETYALSRLLITALFFVLAHEMPHRRRSFALFFLGVAIGGVTLTNIIIFGLVLWAYRGGPRSGWSVVLSEAVRSGAIIAVILVVYYLTITLFKRDPGTEGSAEWVNHFLVTDGHQVALNFINLCSQFVTMIVAALPTHRLYGLSFARALTASTVLVLLAACVLVAIMVGSRQRRPDAWSWVERASVMIIIYNFVLHSFFGREMFLYTQHWVLPTVLLLMPALARWPRAAGAAFMVVAAVNLSFMLGIGPEDVPESRPNITGIRTMKSSVEQ
ncbi:MAG: DUF6080 domain-containing protein, partial [Myxococcota bacterium]